MAGSAWMESSPRGGHELERSCREPAQTGVNRQRLPQSGQTKCRLVCSCRFCLHSVSLFSLNSLWSNSKYFKLYFYLLLGCGELSMWIDALPYSHSYRDTEENKVPDIHPSSQSEEILSYLPYTRYLSTDITIHRCQDRDVLSTQIQIISKWFESSNR